MIIKISENMIKFGEYKGNKTISLLRDENDKYPFTFGVSKAKLIVENFDEIKKFAENEGFQENVKKFFQE